MKTAFAALCAFLIASPAAAQAHARHTAAHDSAHAIALTDAEHLALHQLLLGRWMGTVPMPGGAHRDTLSLQFENDSDHQQLMIRNREGVAGFLIRGDSLQWKQAMGGSPCLASTSVSALVALSKGASSSPAQMKGTILCGADRSSFILKKVG
jgi:hypothetical protein